MGTSTILFFYSLLHTRFHYWGIHDIEKPAKLFKVIIKRGTRKTTPILLHYIPVRYLKFKNTLKSFSSKTLAKRPDPMSGILERQAYNEIPPRVEYRLTNKGQELVESIVYLSQWMRRWSS
jgi:DNA-binding HxlR family transcriptional regulator